MTEASNCPRNPGNSTYARVLLRRGRLVDRRLAAGLIERGLCIAEPFGLVASAEKLSRYRAELDRKPHERRGRALS